MKEYLQRVRGAVATRDLIPVLTHFHIYNGRIQGGNANIVIDSKFPFKSKTITVKAEDFIRVVDLFEGEFKIKITDVAEFSKGKTRIKLPLYDNAAYPLVDAPKGKLLRGIDLSLFEYIRPFVGDDATRPWSCGVLIEDDYMYATNNVVLVRVKHSIKINGRINISAACIDELLRLDVQPKKTVVADNYIGFIFDDDFWLRAQTLTTEWPDMQQFFEKLPKRLPKIQDGLLQAVQTVMPFADNIDFPEIILKDDTVTTSSGVKQAAVAGFSKLPESVFRAEPLIKVLSVATHLDLNAYPQPCAFRSEHLEGVLIGLRK